MRNKILRKNTNRNRYSVFSFCKAVKYKQNLLIVNMLLKILY